MAVSVEWVSEGLRFSSPKEEPGWIVVQTGEFIYAAALIGGPAEANRACSRTNGGEQRTLGCCSIFRGSTSSQSTSSQDAGEACRFR
ncbi:hypothetical protein [Mesorhizobium sp. WSM3859]|uniref:hypothetical protein n=1 Tax=Mesorhizobium sp. WSM3859 TaxID=2029402 RepID=UPI001140CA29|nr:hypothetical protein [Mesorhizobium sp. WSM3859]